MSTEPTKKITLRCTWVTVHEIEVPANYEDTGYLDDFPEELLDEVTSDGAELTDWKEVRR